jgi:signal transduction histidine kinase
LTKSAIRKTLQGEVINELEYTIKSKAEEEEEEERVFLVSTGPLKGGDNVSGAVVVWHDITGRKRLEELRNKLLRDLAHQLKTPLAVVEMSATLIRDEVNPNALILATEPFEMISRNTSEMRNMITGILKLSHLESEGIKINKKPFDITTTIKTILERLRPLAENKKIKLALFADKELIITSDEEKMADVITNVVENAIKYTDEGTISISVQKNGQTNEIRVEDKGIGLTKEQMEHIFQKFYKVDASSKGTGLGLTICKETIRLLGGDITVESKGLNKGSTFTISLPR